jgi:hypothetical protein
MLWNRSGVNLSDRRRAPIAVRHPGQPRVQFAKSGGIITVLHGDENDNRFQDYACDSAAGF